MSRSNPNENGIPNPSKRWFDWSGETGTVRYYDKEQQKTIDCGSDFGFVLLDQLACVRGWHEPSQSGIYSNEVKDTRADVLVVKSFKGGTLAEGLYKDIKDRVNNMGGRFNTNCYIAFKLNDDLVIGSLRFKGAALSAWMDFSKEHRADLYKKAVKIDGYSEGKKGRIVYRVPEFKVVPLSEETNKIAVALDAELQEFLTGYFSRTKRDQVEHTANHLRDEDVMEDERPSMEPITDDDIPFAWLLPYLVPAMLVSGAVLA